MNDNLARYRNRYYRALGVAMLYCVLMIAAAAALVLCVTTTVGDSWKVAGAAVGFIAFLYKMFSWAHEADEHRRTYRRSQGSALLSE